MKKVKLSNKNTFGRPPALYSQKIVIGSEELVGKNIDKVVRQKINSFEKSPKIIRSTALIIKTSRTPIKTSSSLSALSKINPRANNTNPTIKNSNTYSIIDTTSERLNGFNSSESRESLKNFIPVESQVSPSLSVVKITNATLSNDSLETTNTTTTSNTTSTTQKTTVNGSIISTRTRNGPMALAMAIAAAAVAATTSNTSTCGGGNTCKDFPSSVKNGHEPGELQ